MSSFAPSNTLEIVQRFRDAGQVRRVHTLRTLTTHYTDGQHSYDALSLLLLLYPGDPSVDLIKAVLWHDCAELFLGDMPAPAKWEHSDLATFYREAERKVEKENFFPLHMALRGLTDDDRNWLVGVDCLELHLWCGEELMLGNRNVVPVMARLRTVLDNSTNLPENLLIFYKSLRF